MHLIGFILHHFKEGALRNVPSVQLVCKGSNRDDQLNISLLTSLKMDQVLGTDAGGTKEIVDHNETGLLHPPGRPGIEALARNIQYLLREPALREQMGMKGRKKVEKMYLKQHIYKKFAVVLSRCMR